MLLVPHGRVPLKGAVLIECRIRKKVDFISVINHYECV